MEGANRPIFSALITKRPLLWLYAALAAATLLLAEAAAPALLPFAVPADPTDVAAVEKLIDDIVQMGGNPATLWGWAGRIAFFLVAFWILATVNQAALIVATGEATHKRYLSLLDGWRAAGKRLGGVLVADTLVYLPLFILILLGVGALMGILLSFIYLSPSGQPSADLNGGVVAAVLCLIPIVLLTPVLLLVTAWVRPMAIRFVLISGMDGRAAVRHLRPFIRRHFSTLLLTGLAALIMAAVISLTQQGFDQVLTRLPGSTTTIISSLIDFILTTGRVGLISILWTVTVIDLQSAEKS